MISALILTLCFALFIISVLAGSPNMFGINCGWFVAVWAAHCAYYTFFFGIFVLSNPNKYTRFWALDEIGEKPMRAILAGFKKIGVAPEKNLRDIAFLFILFFVLFQWKSSLERSVGRPVVSNDVIVRASLVSFLALFCCVMYILRYFNDRLVVIDAHRNKRRFWDCRLNAGILNDRPDVVGDESFGRFLLELGDYLKNDSFTAERWDAPENIEAASTKPPICYCPDETPSHEETRICLVRIREIHEWIKSTSPTNEARALKVYLVLGSPENAVPQTWPADASWKELANGSVKLYDKKPIVFVAADGTFWTTDTLPETVEDWKLFLGIDEEVAPENALPSQRTVEL